MGDGEPQSPAEGSEFEKERKNRREGGQRWEKPEVVGWRRGVRQESDGT